MRLPLFPLDIALYPGVRTPLHIFEPRYREMLADLRDGDGRFGLLPPPAEDADPETGTIGCIAQVITQQEFPDGRSNILVEGAARFILRRLLDEGTPYLLGRVDPFGDEEGATELPGDIRDQLEGWAERCRRAMERLSESDNPVDWSGDPAALTFQAASVIPWAAEQGRELLPMRSARERAAMLLKVLPRVVPDLESRAAVHERAHTNGKGRNGGAG